MINTIIDRVKERKHFYRNLFRKELIVLIVLLLLQFIWTGMAMYVFMNQKVPAFYASTSDGILTPLKARPTPNRSDKPLLS